VTLRQKIEQEIRQRGPIAFSRYMEMCLYDPDLGYYSRNTEQFGKAGDFYTSSDVHAVFGRLLARQFEEMWRVLGSPAQIEVLELGPGRGLFAQDVLDWSEKKFPDFFQALHYRLVETSPALRNRLQATLERHFSAGKTSLCSASSTLGTSVVPNKAAQARALAPEVPVIVFANELFDALPVEILSSQGELRISEKDGRLVETWNAASPEGLEFLDRYSVHPEAGERIEAPLIAQHFMSQIAATVERGYMIAIDY
jgi:SAM-dependent MidA family methyltransferase